MGAGVCIAAFAGVVAGAGVAPDPWAGFTGGELVALRDCCVVPESAAAKIAPAKIPVAKIFGRLGRDLTSSRITKLPGSVMPALARLFEPFNSGAPCTERPCTEYGSSPPLLRRRR